MTCLDCKNCNTKGNIFYFTDVKGNKYAKFECKQYGETPYVEVDNTSDICCDYFEKENE